MEKSKLVEILLTFDLRERRQFKLWLQSPIHNQRTDVIALFDFLSTADDKSKEAAWAAVHPTEAYDDARMRQVMYFLGKQFEDFLAWQEVQNDVSLQEMTKIRIFRRRKLEKAFLSSIDGLKGMLEQSPKRNSRYLRDMSLIEMETYAYKSTLQRNQILNLQETGDALDLAFIAERLRISCLMLSHQAVYRKADYKHGALQPLFTFIEEQDLLKHPAIAVYYHCYKASIDRTNVEHFKALMKIITDQNELFPIPELRELYLFALNFCIYHINLGTKEYRQLAFEIYKTGFEKDVLLENGIVSRFTYMNAVVNALNVGQYDWADEFISNFAPKLEEAHRKGTMQIARARLYFEQKNYDQAQITLHNYDSNDLLHTLFAKVLLVKIYFAHQDFNLLDSLLDSITVYLKRKKSLDPQRLQGYKNFIKFVKKIAHAWPLSNKEREQIKTKLLETELVLERDWLLEVLNA